MSKRVYGQMPGFGYTIEVLRHEKRAQSSFGRVDRYYIGSTLDITRRLKEHASGRVISTRHWQPVTLVFFQPYQDIVTARGAEYRLKKLKRRDIIERIIREGTISLGP